ncbi:hypothetical protein K2Z84_08580 [Candidatus Binatia bacterium]|nr:hypothetical protein [Candidatus Binatia bacterium]
MKILAVIERRVAIRILGALLAVAFCAACGGGSSGSGSGGQTIGDPEPAEPTPAPTPAITAGNVIFVNYCLMDLTIYSTGPSIGTLAANGGTVTIPVSSFNQGGQNLIIPYPDTTTGECPASYCDGWTDLGGTPGTVQREGYMWDGTNSTYAAYCNPNLSGRGICAQQMNCCGPNMVQDGTFGTHWEFTPAGGGGNDYPNLSTNYGTGPDSPPNLCPVGAPNNCVSAAANIFFNVPIQWTTNLPCSFTSGGTQVTGLQCFTADCSDAYQYPIDDKQCACTSSAQRGYLVEYCPAGSTMPLPPTAMPAAE